MLAFLAAFAAGDRVAVALPGYPPYRHILSALGCEPVLIETNMRKRAGRLPPSALLAAHRARPLKGVIVASPANPTGTMMTAPRSRELIQCAEDADIAVISDEIYHGLDYAFPAESARASVVRGGHHQFVLEIFLHDRLAHRLDGRAAAAGARRSSGCSKTWLSRCQRCRKSRRKQRSTAVPSWRR